MKDKTVIQLNKIESMARETNRLQKKFGDWGSAFTEAIESHGEKATNEMIKTVGKYLQTRILLEEEFSN